MCCCYYVWFGGSYGSAPAAVRERLSPCCRVQTFFPPSFLAAHYNQRCSSFLFFIYLVFFFGFSLFGNVIFIWNAQWKYCFFFGVEKLRFWLVDGDALFVLIIILIFAWGRWFLNSRCWCMSPRHIMAFFRIKNNNNSYTHTHAHTQVNVLVKGASFFFFHLILDGWLKLSLSKIN